MVPFSEKEAATRIPQVVMGGCGLGRTKERVFCLAVCMRGKPNPTGAVYGCELGIETIRVPGCRGGWKMAREGRRYGKWMKWWEREDEKWNEYPPTAVAVYPRRGYQTMS